MKAFNRAVDKFCYRHPRFGIPNLMMYIIGGTAIVYIIAMMDTTGTFTSYLYFNAQLILRGQVWRLVTFLFIPTSGSLLSMVLFLYFYYFVGSTLERTWGSGKFTIFYFGGVILTVIFAIVVGLVGYPGAYLPITSQYINLSLFFAFAMLYPETMVMLFFFIPIKIKWIAIVNAAFFIYEMIVTAFPMNLLPLVAAVNVLLFCGSELFSPFKTARTQRASNFRREADAARRQQQARTWRHRCEVCGRTDTDNPQLEFRYCSRCSGYHCFCSDHIYDHTHRTE